LFGGTFMGITALTIAFARGQSPAGRGTTVIGLLTAAFALGQVIGPLMAARLASDAASFGPAFLTAALVVAVGGLLVLVACVLTRRERAGAFPP
jgi:hypothetical protein